MQVLDVPFSGQHHSPKRTDERGSSYSVGSAPSNKHFLKGLDCGPKLGIVCLPLPTSHPLLQYNGSGISSSFSPLTTFVLEQNPPSTKNPISIFIVVTSPTCFQTPRRRSPLTNVDTDCCDGRAEVGFNGRFRCRANVATLQNIVSVSTSFSTSCSLFTSTACLIS